jgi:DNA-binding IclR family transcriptional regulator
MLSVLERRGYLIRKADSTYSLSLKLFELSHRHPPIKKMLGVALPVMEELTRTTRQSAHLAVYHDQRILVVAQVDSPEPMGFAVRLGTHYPIRLDRTSARVITAFQGEPLRGHLIAQMIENSNPPIGIDVLSEQLNEITRRGYYEAPSYTTSGITDISCPIFDHRGQVAAALTVPYLKQQFVTVSFDEVLAETQHASRIISEGLGFSTQA